jgi:O-antigen/teichoic acid export membrane protein
MRSFTAVGIGMLLALAIGLLVVQGILAPIFTSFFGMERSGPAALPLLLLVFASAFSFYFGGMAASYKAPSRHRLHGILVVPSAVVLSLVLNLALGRGILPVAEGAGTVILFVVFIIVSAAASYVGAQRGAELHAHNERFKQRR